MELPDLIDVVRPAVVQIRSTIFPRTDADKAKIGGKMFRSQPLGTGFFVNEDAHVMTAQHVLEGARSLRAQFPGSDVSLGVGLAWPNTENMRGNFNVVGFEVVEEDQRHDLALLKMLANPFKGEVGPGIVVNNKPLPPLYAVPELRAARPRDGDSIAISGYPLGESVLITNTGIVASSWSMTIDEVANPNFPGTRIPHTSDVYLADVQSNPGNSGGPVYSTRDGAIVGVLVAGKLTNVVAGGEPVTINGLPVSADAGLSLVVPAKYVVELLGRHGCDWSAA